MTGRIEREVTIVNKRGLHARAAAKFVKLTGGFNAAVEVSKGGETVSGSSIMGLLMLAAAPGCRILIAAEGVDAVAAVDAIERLVADRFHED